MNIYSSLIYPAVDKIRKIPIEEYRKFYNQSQWWSYEKIKEFQLQRLRKLLSFVYGQNRYYQNLLIENHLHYDDFTKSDDLTKIPILTKELIKNYNSILKSLVFDSDAIEASTGGSTGEPLVYYHDKITQASNRALHRRGLGWAGFNIGDPTVAIMASSLDKKRSKIESFIRRILTNQLEISAESINNENIVGVVNQINQRRAKALIGYSSNLWWLAKNIIQSNIRIKVPVVFTTSETLLPAFRESIETAFAARVFDFYGLGEIQGICYQCEYGKYHISEEKVIAECIPLTPSNPNLGTLVLTDLTNYSFPFIRYATGDIIELSEKECDCGRKLLSINKIIGRMGDLLVFDTGQIISSAFISVLFRQYRSISEYQVVQETQDNLKIFVVRNKASTTMDFETELLELKKWFIDFTKGKVIIDTNQTESIKRTKSGKLRTTISNVNKNITYNENIQDLQTYYNHLLY